MRVLLCLLSLLSLLHGILGQVVLPVLPQYPSRDDFYEPPEGDSWKTNAPSQARAYQLLFVTQDVHKEPATTVTTIVVPKEANLNRLLSFQNAYDSPDIDCSPSYGFQNQATCSAHVWNQGQLFVLGTFPAKGGPVINIPDYQGSNAAFTVGPQAAYQTLDSIKAALNSQDITGLSPEANTVLYGYSGGGLATEWATEFHASYAPTLNVIGAAMGGLPTNISDTHLNVNNGMFSELNVLATLGLANAYSEVDVYLNDHLISEYKDKFFYPQVRCGPHEGIDEQPALSDTNITALFDNGNDILTHFKELIEEIGLMGQHINETHTPSFPLYIWAGMDDDVVRPIANIAALVKTFRDAGTSVTYVPWFAQGHLDTLFLGMGPARAWINNRFKDAEKSAHFNAISNAMNEDLPMDGTEAEYFADWPELESQQILKDEQATRNRGYEL